VKNEIEAAVPGAKVERADVHDISTDFTRITSRAPARALRPE
jgi:hypothetical protein